MVWASDTDFLNAALVLINQEQITNISEESPAAVQGLTAINTLKPMLIARHPWRFALKRALLQRYETSEDAALWGFKYEFEKPSWLIGEPHNVSAQGDVFNTQWKLRGNSIFANIESAVIEGCFLPSVSHWPVHFCNFAAYALAAQLALLLPRDEALSRQRHIEAYGSDSAEGMGGLFMVARQIDGKNEPVKELRIASGFTSARSF